MTYMETYVKNYIAIFRTKKDHHFGYGIESEQIADMIEFAENYAIEKFELANGNTVPVSTVP